LLVLPTGDSILARLSAHLKHFFTLSEFHAKNHPFGDAKNSVKITLLGDASDCAKC